jgi:type VI secretion system secreted protein Hcp
MALNAYLSLRGQRQGEIRGDSDQPGREHLIPVIAASHEIISPRDPASGLPTGRRVHRPIVITKAVDLTSPLLELALVNNENITTFQLGFWRRNAAGAEEQYYTIDLTNASIAGIRLEMLNNVYPENASHAVREHVTFTYQRITWTYVDGGIIATDDWGAPA